MDSEQNSGPAMTPGALERLMGQDAGADELKLTEVTDEKDKEDAPDKADVDAKVKAVDDVKALEAEPAEEDFGLEPDSAMALDKARARLQRLESTGEATAWLQRLGLPQYAA